MGMAAVGAGMQVGGQIGSGYGQHEAVKNMQGVWQEQQMHQGQANDQLRALTESLLQNVGIEQTANQPGAEAMQQKLNAVTANTTKGAQAALAKRGGRLGPEERARTAQAYDAAGADSQRLAQYLAQLYAYHQGANRVDQAGRQFALDRGAVVRNAGEWQGLAPIQIRAAGMTGGDLRRIGTSMQGAGQSAIYAGESQPGTPAYMDEKNYSNSTTVTARPQGPAQAPKAKR